MSKSFDREKVIDCMFDPITSEILAELENGKKECSVLSQQFSMSEFDLLKRLTYLIEHEFLFKINNDQKNIILGIGGSGPTKRVPAKTFIKLMHLISNVYKCRFFLATGKDKEEQEILKEILDTKFKDKCVPLDKLSISETLPIIKNCDASICNDSSFSHLSSGLGIKTIVLMADTPLIYGSYSPRMYPIIPDAENTVTHNTLGKDKINSDKIFDQLKKILN